MTLLKPRRIYLGLCKKNISNWNLIDASFYSNLYFDVKSTHTLSKIYIWDHIQLLLLTEYFCELTIGCKPSYICSQKHFGLHYELYGKIFRHTRAFCCFVQLFLKEECKFPWSVHLFVFACVSWCKLFSEPHYFSLRVLLVLYLLATRQWSVHNVHNGVKRWIVLLHPSVSALYWSSAESTGWTFYCAGRLPLVPY